MMLNLASIISMVLTVLSIVNLYREYGVGSLNLDQAHRQKIFGNVTVFIHHIHHTPPSFTVYIYLRDFFFRVKQKIIPQPLFVTQYFTC
jgi:hypothetical protein